MTTNNKCPLCGKPVEDNNHLCEDCQNHVDNQYETDFLSVQNDTSQSEEEQIESENDEESNVISLNQINEEETITHPTTKKKKTSKTLLFIFVFCGLMIVLGTLVILNARNQKESIELEQHFWDSCVVVNTPLSYAKYLVTFQQGSYVDEAHKRIRELRLEEDSTWSKLKKSSDINEYYNYLGTNPNTPYLKTVRFRMDSLTWIITLKSDNKESYLAYLENVKLGNITGTYSSIAQERYDYLSQIKELEGNALDSIKNQISSFFLALSMYDDKVLLENTNSKVDYYSQVLEPQEIIPSIKLDLKANKLKKINFQANKNSLKAITDNKGITSIDLLVNKETIDSANKKNYSVDTVRIELNKNNKIQSVSLK